MAPQVVRLGIVLGVFVVSFLGIRAVTVPQDFGKNGFHRAQATTVLAKRSMKHAGMQKCMECHPDKAASPHIKAGLSCETCHGPALAHAEDFDKVKPSIPVQRAFCGRCHDHIVGRPKTFPQVDVKTHNPEGRCVDCHEDQIHPEATNG